MSLLEFKGNLGLRVFCILAWTSGSIRPSSFMTSEIRSWFPLLKLVWILSLLLTEVSGFALLRILEKPWPTRVSQSLGSLIGSFPHELYSTLLPLMLMRFFSHEAHDIPPRGFLDKRASSSVCFSGFCWFIISSNMFLIYLSRILKFCFVSVLSANFLYRLSTISFNFSKILYSSFQSSLVSALGNIWSFTSLNYLFTSSLSRPISIFLSQTLSLIFLNFSISAFDQ